MKLAKQIKTGAKNAVNRTEQGVDSVKLNHEIHELEEKVEKDFKKLGKLHYDHFNEKNPRLNEETTTLIAEIQAYYAEIEKLEKTLSKDIKEKTKEREHNREVLHEYEDEKKRLKMEKKENEKVKIQ